MTTLPLEAPHATTVTPAPAPPSSGDPLRPATERAQAAPRRSHALDLSRARTHDAVLDILNAYKLSGNFHDNLEIVLKDIGIFDMVTYRTERHPAAFPDCQHVVFTFSGDFPDDRCDDIITAMKARIGFDAPWWGRLKRLRRQ